MNQSSYFQRSNEKGLGVQTLSKTSTARLSWQTSRQEAMQYAFSPQMPIESRFPSVRSCLWARPFGSTVKTTQKVWKQYVPSLIFSSSALQSMCTQNNVTLKSSCNITGGYVLNPTTEEHSQSDSSLVYVRREEISQYSSEYVRRKEMNPPQSSSSVINTSIISSSSLTNGLYNLNCLIQISFPAFSVKFTLLFPPPTLFSCPLVDALLQSQGLRGIRSPVHGAQCGPLTLNSLRQVIPLLSSDPAIRTTPVVGMWLRAPEKMTNEQNTLENSSWAEYSLHHPLMRAVITYYFDSRDFGERVYMPDAPNTMLLVILPSHDTQESLVFQQDPAFFECTVNWPRDEESYRWTGLDVCLQAYIQLHDNTIIDATSDTGIVSVLSDSSLQWSPFSNNLQKSTPIFDKGAHVEGSSSTSITRPSSFAANITALGFEQCLRTTPPRHSQHSQYSQQSQTKIPSPKFQIPSKRFYSPEREQSVTAFAASIVRASKSQTVVSDESQQTNLPGLASVYFQKPKEQENHSNKTNDVSLSESLISDQLDNSYRLDDNDHQTLRDIKSNLDKLTRVLSNRLTDTDIMTNTDTYSEKPKRMNIPSLVKYNKAQIAEHDSSNWLKNFY
jgi:hypothetical protein